MMKSEINEIGRKIADEYGIAYLFSDFKKNEGFKKSIELSHKFNLYRQNYCGCEYSIGLKDWDKKNDVWRFFALTSSPIKVVIL